MFHRHNKTAAFKFIFIFKAVLGIKLPNLGHVTRNRKTTHQSNYTVHFYVLCNADRGKANQFIFTCQKAVVETPISVCND